MKFLIIEDNPQISQILNLTLKANWPDANLLSTFYGQEGVELARKELPDIIILDIMLPDIGGFEVLRQVRTFSAALVVILTAMGEEDNRIKGLQEGADDYIVKPFSTRELVARLQSLIRRQEMCQTPATATTASKIPEENNLVIDTLSQKATLGNRLLKIGPREYELLHLLVSSEGTAIPKRTLMKEVFPENAESDTRFVDVYIKKLREALGDAQQLIFDESTTGYKFSGKYSIVRGDLKSLDS